VTADSDTTPRPTTAAQDTELALGRARALEAMPYFAPLLFPLGVLHAPGLGTFAKALRNECGHLFRDDAGRADARAVRDGERTAWNVAAGVMLNFDLV
jgi:hypothetical protein